MKQLLLASAAIVAASPAWALDCSGTATQTSAPIVFPTRPQSFITITNPNTSGSPKLAVNPDAAAAIDTRGSLPLDGNGSFWTWSFTQGYPLPNPLNIIGGSASSPFTCKYN